MSTESGENCARDPRAARQSDRGGLTVEQLSDEPWGRRRPRMRRLCRDLRPGDHQIPARAVAGQREDAEHLAGRPAGRARLPEPPVHDDCRGGGRAVRCADLHPEHRRGVWVCDRRPAVRVDRIHRHERVGALERARSGGCAWRGLTGAEGRVPRRRDHRPARGRARAVRRRRLLRRADLAVRRQPENGGGRADRPRLRWFADLGVREAGRRNLHQGGRRRRRPRRQGRGGHSRGRPAQPGDDRGQRGRQRRRLRRHGGRPVRDLRGDRGRRDPARGAHVPRGYAGRAVSARDRGRGDHRLDHRHVRGAHAARTTSSARCCRASSSPACLRLPRSLRSPTG